MKSILIFTLGSRDLQLFLPALQENGIEVQQTREESFIEVAGQKICVYPQLRDKKYLILSNPRKGGQTIYENWETLKDFVRFPILKPLIVDLRNKESNPFKSYAIATNQEPGFKKGTVSEDNYSKDTIWFYYCLQKAWPKWLSGELTDISLQSAVVNMDLLYRQLGKALSSIIIERGEELDAVFLFNQSGIDQINQTLTLRLIERYREKLIQLQKAEGQSSVKELKFPALFLENLNKHKLRQLNQDFHFHSICEILPHNPESTIYALAFFSNRLLSLNEKVETLIEKKWRQNQSVEVVKLMDEMVNLVQKKSNRSELTYLSIKVRYLQGQLESALWRFYALSEIILQPFVGAFLWGHGDWDFSIEGFTRALRKKNIYNRVIKKVDPDKNGNVVPNGYCLKKLVELGFSNITADQKGVLTKILNRLSSLRQKRNELVHQGKMILPTEFDNIVKPSTPDSLFAILDEFYGLKDNGVFDKARSIIDAELN